jgi:hypothetical protein
VLAVVLTAYLQSSAAEQGRGSDPAAQPVAINKPLIAYWTFDEEDGQNCTDSSGNGNEASPEAGRGVLRRVEGVFGSALSLSGHHMLRAPGKPDFAGVTRISLSAWTLPTAFERYNEIFRKEDGDNRVLFSFQESMTVLSLGLNINGYMECDARITPAQLLDGGWHHCAATFDGKVMRVYLDGKEIGSLERPGPIVAGGPAPGCIGSSNGGECFQGMMDDLRLYKDALTAGEVASLYKSGLKALDKFSRDVEQDLQAFFAPGKTFAETLAASRRSLIEKRIPATPKLLAAARARLKARFPDDFDRFITVTGTSPMDYLAAKSNGFHLREAGRLVEMITEYKPLTERQWKSQPPEQAAKWKEAEAIERRFEALKAQGDAAAFSPDWIELMLDASKPIERRPYAQEAVAPYVKPSTPETRSLPAAEARAALERDWLHQADNNPTLDRIKSEIAWARALAERIRSEDRLKAGLQTGLVDLAPELAELDTLEKQLGTAPGPSRDLYLRVREAKRRITFRNPVVDFTRVLLVDMPFPQGSEWPHETRHRLGYMAVPGGRLLILDGLSPDGKLTQLMPQPPLHGSFWRPDVSYDGKKVLFCFKPHNEKPFHLYEINIDGSGLTQLTDGIYDDFDPIYLPDERHIIFSTTRGHTYVRCMPPTNAYVLARADHDGSNIYLISANNEPDYLPSVASDGRILYTRWEYTDKPLWRAQGLWTMHPDGTQVNTLWGNQTVWPDLLKDVRSIPGSRRVMFTGSAHHNWFSGSVGIIDPGKGFNFPDGLTKVTADVAWPESGNGPIDPIESPAYHRSGHYAAFYSPYPLSEKDFLVSANRGGKFVLYLMDTDGNRELVYEGVHNIFHALPLKPRSKPPVLADEVDWPGQKDRLQPKGGVIYSNNVYQGAPDELRGKAKFLRVLSIDHKTYTYWHKRPYLSTGPVVSGVQSEGVKRVLGTVPIEEDGSVAFRAPSGIPLHFQLLDGERRALQTMRSFANVMPGERRGCLGCHELHSTTPETYSKTLALSREPRQIAPPPWGEDTVSYPRYVRPVLDKHCAKCHTGEGKGRQKVDMTPRPGFLGFDETYWLFTGRPAWGAPYVMPKDPPPGFGIADMLMVEGYDQRDPAGYQTPKPMTKLSYKSRLIEIASSGKHNGVKVDPISLERLILWVDAMCPYLGDEEVREIPDPVFQGVEWLAIRPRIQTAPRIIRPGPVD